MKKLIPILMKSLSTIACSSLIFLMTSGTSAMAISLSLGAADPITGGSWTRSWVLGGTDEFNRIDAFITSGDTDFGHSHSNDNPGLDRFSNDGWGANQINEDYSHASGSSSTSMSFWSTVSADIDKPFEIDIWVSHDDHVLGGFHVRHLGYDSWDKDSHHDFDYHDWDKEKDKYDRDCRPRHVPEPGTLLLLGSGLLGMAVLRKKFKV